MDTVSLFQGPFGPVGHKGEVNLHILRCIINGSICIYAFLFP